MAKSLTPFELLKRSYEASRVVHGYLFFGSDKSEILTVAKSFSKLILAVDEVGEKLIDTDEHANVVLIKPDGKNIKKEQILFLKAEMVKKAVEDRNKVYIIEDAHKMSTSATNSLLKFLEEPSAGVYIILIAPSKEVLLPTIISRTANIGFTQAAEEIHIEPQYLTVITALEGGQFPYLVMAQHTDMVKEGLPELLDAYTQYLKQEMKKAIDTRDVLLLQRIVKKIKGLELAKRHLSSNMNVQLCLDELWQNLFDKA